MQAVFNKSKSSPTKLRGTLKCPHDKAEKMLLDIPPHVYVVTLLFLFNTWESKM